MRHQRGGTILGLILGLLIGVGAALAVAVYVTNVPVPFVNKGGGLRGEAKDNIDDHVVVHPHHPVGPV